ncbi:hypothetical protein Bhyg_11533 [Pseudolycoriella hygida]|uniref:Uncharacterized protein n=1 Tax=Pseudolycoriella hygida TaxID=35572 RepID=A0A9Q0MXD2_9DIPT|nr:hypothetical protein Bhyg_11533 [Pseudolycoriella hygida]
MVYLKLGNLRLLGSQLGFFMTQNGLDADLFTMTHIKQCNILSRCDGKNKLNDADPYAAIKLPADKKNTHISPHTFHPKSRKSLLFKISRVYVT